MKKIFLVAIMAVFTSSAFAQLMTGKSAAFAQEESPNWGYIYMQYNPGVISPDQGKSEAVNGFSLGWNQDFRLGSIPLFLEIGVGLQLTLASDFNNQKNVNFTMFSSKVPVSVGYMFSIPNTPIDIIPNAGFDFRVNGLAQKSGDGLAKDINLLSSNDMGSSDATWNVFQVGGHIGVNARFWKKLLVGFSYQGDFSEIAKKTHMYQGNLTVGYCW